MRVFRRACTSRITGCADISARPGGLPYDVSPLYGFPESYWLLLY